MRRRRWRRQPGNDGHIRVWVPAGEQEPKAEAWRDDRTDSHPDTLADLRSGVMEVIRPLQDAIAVLEAQLTEANARAVRADDRADVLRQQLDAARTEATHAAARTEAAEEEARKAQDAAEALRQRERAWWGQGRWARLRAAWRGQ
jgi:hypothetical protein